MDLNKFDTKTKANQGVPMELRDLDGEVCMQDNGDPVTILLLGIDSDKYQKIESKVADERLKSSMSGGRMKLKSAELTEGRIKLLTACTVGWDGITEGGEPLECSQQNVERVYTDYPLIREQVNTFINDRSNFLGN